MLRSFQENLIENDCILKIQLAASSQLTCSSGSLGKLIRQQTIMAAQRESIFLTENCRVKIIKLKIKEGSNITIGQILFHFEPEENSAVGNGNNGKPVSNGPSKNTHVVRATTAGLVEKLYVKEGDLIDPGFVFYLFKINSSTDSFLSLGLLFLKQVLVRIPQ